MNVIVALEKGKLLCIFRQYPVKKGRCFSKYVLFKNVNKNIEFVNVL